MSEAEVPDGFERHFRRSGLTDPWEPLYSRKLDDRVQIGLTLAAPHCNSRGLVHGGLIAALADNAMGSGTFINQETGKQVRYTMKDDLSYDQTENSMKLLWKPGQQFASGRYDIEVYNKGYLVGTTSLVLR